jgi:U3 small nucleolar RNA-associated protein 20
MALSLLKAIVSRKLLVPELYDMMNRVAQLMVTSYVVPVRQLCSQILLQFLLDYPLGKKRLQQHMDFFITNVGYVL